jgi:hypothetical protein
LQAKRNRDFARLREAQGDVISFTKENQVLLNLKTRKHVAERGSSAWPPAVRHARTPVAKGDVEKRL